MKVLTWQKENFDEIGGYLLSGKVAVLPSETLYGIMASALNKDAVERVYKIKGRKPDKPCIILINKIADLAGFGISPTAWQQEKLEKYWPGKVSMILECNKPELEYLHRGTKTLAFRLPDSELLRSLLERTGPLVAPSANPEDQNPALTIATAQEYFGDQVDLYLENGELNSPPSTVVSLVDGELAVLRGELKN